MTAIKSSNVQSYGYDAATGTLVVVYKGDVRWDYLKVPQERKDEMDQINAAGGSIGQYIHARIKGYYDGQKVSSEQ
jgi:hypothetical protein